MPSFGKRTPFSDQYLKPFEDCFHATPSDESHGQIPLSLEGRLAGMQAVERCRSDCREGRGEGELNPETRWRCFSREWINTQKGDSLDIAWLKDQDSVDAASLPEPDVLAAEAMSDDLNSTA